MQVDPAAGTGGFLLAAHEYASRDAETLTPTERTHLRDGFVHGVELVDGTARLAAMNLILHGIGTPTGESLIEVKDALIADPGEREGCQVRVSAATSKDGFLAGWLSWWFARWRS